MPTPADEQKIKETWADLGLPEIEMGAVTDHQENGLWY